MDTAAAEAAAQKVEKAISHSSMAENFAKHAHHNIYHAKLQVCKNQNTDLPVRAFSTNTSVLVIKIASRLE